MPELSNSVEETVLSRILAERGSSGMIDCVNWPEVTDYKPEASFKIGHDKKSVYILFENTGLGIKAINSANQSPVSQDSCVEFFVQPDVSSDRYWNFEFNAIGAVNASNRITRPEPVRLTDEQIFQIKRFPSAGTSPFEEKEGEQEWSLLVVIPLSLMNVSFKDESVKMRANFLKCGSRTTFPHYLSWAPIKTEKPDFHQPNFFGEIILEK